ncbi:MAG: LPS assembly lipoprotein LptE, partial [Bdellovibrionota bacterium]
GFRNQTYRPGIEHYFSTAMVREIASSKSFVLVNNEKDADAILSGNVSATEDNVASTNYVTVQDRQLPVASEYDATVSCSIQLVDRHGRTVFAQSVAADKVHPGSGAVGDVGAAGNTNNDSEQRLAIQFLANQMMASVYQRMVDTF